MKKSNLNIVKIDKSKNLFNYEKKILINELKIPSLRANDAFIQADTLISEIDLLLRSRQTDALLKSVESPLRPSIWVQAVLQSFNALFAPIKEFRLIEISDVQKTNLMKNTIVPIYILYIDQ